jgi:hypothetical protein
VYKGILNRTTVVALKKLKVTFFGDIAKNMQSDDQLEEFRREAILL